MKYLIGNMLGFTIKNFSLKILLFTTCVSYVLISLFSNYLNKKAIKKEVFCKVVLKQKEKKIEITALVDTGNGLKEPFTNNHVIVVEFEKIKSILPDPLKLIFYEKRENDYTYILENIKDIKIRFIPFKALGVENGTLLGIFMEKVVLYEENEKKEVNNVVIAIYNSTLGKDFEGLVNPSILK